MTVKEVLLGAAQVIRERGWCQNAYELPGGRVCSLGAMKVVLGLPAASYPLDSQLFLAAVRAAEDASGYMFSLATWQDRSGRTVEEVLSVLEKAAEAAS